MEAGLSIPLLVYKRHMPVPLDIAQLGHCKNKEQKFFAVLTNLVQVSHIQLLQIRRRCAMGYLQNILPVSAPYG